MNHCKHGWFHTLAMVLTVVGALNWGLFGAGMLAKTETNLNLVNLLVGTWPTVEAVVYLLVGLSAVVVLLSCMKGSCKEA
ncbi:hypothetical protein CVV38_02215 [Candidatus Peregrinibacteria bacterium HGW-Peregrinibacteria-1]|nr:MAG: hypothetical protein CVV38_02215 [Candidatus Peregrinibacteria bacterium HGW-Peregrinibacteria-1]